MNINDLDPSSYKVVGDKPLNINDLDPKSYQVQEPGIYDSYVKPVVEGGLGLMNKVSSYTDAPTRSAIYAAEQEPNWSNKLGAAYKAGMAQMGQPPETAPSAEKVYSEPLGLSKNWTIRWPYSDLNPTVSEAGGEVANAVMNPLNLIPGAPEAKAGTEAERGLLAKGAESVASPVRKGLSAIGETTSGINKNITEAYAKDTPAVNSLIDKYRGDDASHLSDVRQVWNKKLTDAKTKLDNQITDGLSKIPKYNNIDITDVATALENQKARLNPKTQADAISQIDKHLDVVKSLSDVITDEPHTIEVPWKKSELNPETPIYRGKHPDNGKGDWTLDPGEAVSHASENGNVQVSKLGVIPRKQLIGGYDSLFPGEETNPIVSLKHLQSETYPAKNFPTTMSVPNEVSLEPGSYVLKTNLKDLHDIKKYLQERGNAAYNENGQRFEAAPKAAQAAVDAAYVARKTFEHNALDEAPMKVIDANRKYSQLHDIFDRMPRNVLRDGAPDTNVVQAALNPVGSNMARNLRDLKEITGYDFQKDASRYAAAKQFANTSVLPVDLTGKSTARQNLVGNAADLAGAAITTPIGYAVGKAAGNPWLGGAVGYGLRKTVAAPIKYAVSPAGIKAGINMTEAAKQVPQGLLNVGAAISPRGVAKGLLHGK